MGKEGSGQLSIPLLSHLTGYHMWPNQRTVFSHVIRRIPWLTHLKSKFEINDNLDSYSRLSVKYERWHWQQVRHIKTSMLHNWLHSSRTTVVYSVDQTCAEFEAGWLASDNISSLTYTHRHRCMFLSYLVI